MNYKDYHVGDFLGVSESWVYKTKNTIKIPRPPLATLFVLAHKSRLEMNSIVGMRGDLFIEHVKTIMAEINFGENEEYKKLKALRKELAHKRAILRCVDPKINSSLVDDVKSLEAKVHKLEEDSLTRDMPAQGTTTTEDVIVTEDTIAAEDTIASHDYKRAMHE